MKFLLIIEICIQYLLIFTYLPINYIYSKENLKFEKNLLLEFEISGCFDVDIVYTWVNGTDPIWVEKRRKIEKKLNITLSNKTVKSRFIDFNELIFSIRSVEKFIPWFNKIFIITDNQKNFFLKDNSRIIYINHSTIFPQEALPTFNSNAIELSIFRIPNLSEHFLYFNDDYFISKPLKKNDFFEIDGRTKFYPSRRRWNRLAQIFSAYEKNPNRDSDSTIQFFSATSYTTLVFNVKTKVKPNIVIQHAVFACSKTIMKKAYFLFEKEINETIHHHFRTYKDILFQSLMLYVALINPNYSIIVLKKKGFFRYISLSQYGFHNLSAINLNNYMTICINTCQHTTVENQIKAKNWLKSWLIQPSSFEIPNSSVIL